MSERTIDSLVKLGTRMSSESPADILVPRHLPAAPGSPELGMPVMLLQKRNTPEGPRTEITRFDCTCDPPLSCITPTRKARGAKGRRERRRDLARGLDPSAVAKDAGQG